MRLFLISDIRFIKNDLLRVVDFKRQSAGPYNARSVAFLIAVYKFMGKTIREHDFRYAAIFYRDMIQNQIEKLFD